VIGYYVHHQGRGHLTRMLSITARLDSPVTVLSSLAPPPEAAHLQWVRLSADDSGDRFPDADARGTLHWVPRHHPGLRGRMAAVAAWIDRHDPELVVVDVSVEIATLCRLLGVPTVVMAMRGDRSDRAHRLAYDAADALVAPWSADFPEPGWPDHWYDKTFHTGALSRFAGRPVPDRTPHGGPRRVLVLWGSGGAGLTPAQLDAARAAPDTVWRVADGGLAADDVWDALQWADVVVTHAGQNAVAEVAAAQRPAVVIADDRPHGEQQATAVAVGSTGAALGVTGWAARPDWPGLLDRAAVLDGRGWRRWTHPQAAARAAGHIESLAATRLSA
jgi:UDP-N-acetylglucosamine--N-acetylmuramyl-(pentapeptide) pyrophosphoryl-undecaprenol N-acetylglucosamine transferase